MKLFRLLFLLLLPLIAGAQNIYTYMPITYPGSMIADNTGSLLYINNGAEAKIWKIDLTTGTVSTYVGVGVLGFGGDGGLATSALITGISSMAVNKHGDLFFTDASNHRIRKVEKATGIITTIAGDGTDGYPASGMNALSQPLPLLVWIAIDSNDNIFFSDWGSNNRIGKIDAVAGTILDVYNAPHPPKGLCIDKNQNIYYLTLGNITRLDINLNATIVAGTVSPSCTISGGTALGTSIFPGTFCIVKDSSIYFSETQCNVIKKLDLSSQTLTTIAGTGAYDYTGDGGPVTNATFKFPQAIALDSCGNMYICDHSNHCVRRIDYSPSCFPTFPAGVKNIASDEASIYLYPNPVATELTISSTEKISSVAIVDLTGRTVLQRTVNCEQVTVDVSTLVSGVYFVALRDDRGVSKVVKFVKE